MSDQTNEVATRKPQTLKALLLSDAVQRQIALALPSHMTAERMCRVALTAMLKTPKLAQCSQESFMQAMLTLSQMGLEPDGRHAHLIPYGNVCQPIADYKGLVQLALRSDQVAKIHADVVCENDEFEYDLGAIGRHRIDFREPRGAVFAVYAMCEMKDGSVACEVMSRLDVELIRSRSRSGNSGPWVTDWNEMAKKTVFKRLSKWLPLSSEYRDAVDLEDNEPVRIDQTTVLDMQPVSDKASRIAAMMEGSDAAPESSDTESELPGEPEATVAATGAEAEETITESDETPDAASQTAAEQSPGALAAQNKIWKFTADRISAAKTEAALTKIDESLQDLVETDKISQAQFHDLRGQASTRFFG